MAKPTYAEVRAEVKALRGEIAELENERDAYKETARRVVLHSFVRADAAADGGLDAEDVATALKTVRARGLNTLDDIAKCEPHEMLAAFKALWRASDASIEFEAAE